jgi:hypothetical protein
MISVPFPKQEEAHMNKQYMGNRLLKTIKQGEEQ